MKTLRDHQIRGKGLSGTYFKVSSSKGVKIIGKGYQSQEILLRRVKTSNRLQNIIKEATIGILANSATKTVEVVKYKKRFFLGIVQNHLTTKNVSYKIVVEVQKDLRKRKIAHGDLHGGNIRWNKNQAVAMDYDPERACFVGDKRAYYTVKTRLVKKLLCKT